MTKILVRNDRVNVAHFVASQLERFGRAPKAMLIERVDDDTLAFEVDDEPGAAQFEIVELMVARAFLDFDKADAAMKREKDDSETEQRSAEARVAVEEGVNGEFRKETPTRPTEDK